MNSQLSPAEALVLLWPKHTTAHEAVIVTLLWLIAQGWLRIEEEIKRGFVAKKRIAYYG